MVTMLQVLCLYHRGSKSDFTWDWEDTSAEKPKLSITVMALTEAWKAEQTMLEAEGSWTRSLAWSVAHLLINGMFPSQVFPPIGSPQYQCISWIAPQTPWWGCCKDRLNHHRNDIMRHPDPEIDLFIYYNQHPRCQCPIYSSCPIL